MCLCENRDFEAGWCSPAPEVLLVSVKPTLITSLVILHTLVLFLVLRVVKQFGEVELGKCFLFQLARE